MFNKCWWYKCRLGKSIIASQEQATSSAGDKDEVAWDERRAGRLASSTGDGLPGLDDMALDVFGISHFPRFNFMPFVQRNRHEDGNTTVGESHHE